MSFSLPAFYLFREDAHLAYKDAIFFSMHKFVGGVNSPGILVVKKNLFRNPTPHQCGGGTVFFVSNKADNKQTHKPNFRMFDISACLM